MKFEEIKVSKPNEKALIAKIEEMTSELKKAKTAQEAIMVVKKFYKFSDKVDSNFTVISIRHSIDMNDKKIAKLSDACDEIGPRLSEYVDKFNHAMVDSKFKQDLIKKFGQVLFDRIENQFKLFKPEIIEDSIKENQLCNEYSKLIAGAKIEFKGETHNLSSLGKYFSDSDRETRKEAYKAFYGYIEEHDKEFGKIYDDLVHVRNTIAKKLGFKNAIEYFYLRMGRLDYNAKMVAGYRKQILEDVVPVTIKLRKQQAKRIEIRQPLWLDYNLKFKSGNPKPAGKSDYLIKSASKMYHEMSDFTGDIFDKMANDHLLDLDAKPGKMTGGYMTFIPKIKMPFIFSNSNGTAGDVDTLTHEFGHSLQGYLCGKMSVPSYRNPTMESCEIHSMSMEFFAWPWMNLFFNKDADKYRFQHLSDAFEFLPYGAEVDEFQHWVYENPDVSHEKRCEKWAEIDHKYRPDFNYKGFEFVQSHLWIRQAHIYQSPFYYIDYTLAQVLALQFKCEMDKNREKAWKKYIKLCKMGGKYSFLTLLEKAHLRNPFVEGNIKKVVRPQVKILNSIDSSKF